MTNTWFPIPADDRLHAVLARDVKVGRTLDGLPLVWPAGAEVVVNASAWETGAPLVAYRVGSLRGAVVAPGVLQVP